MPASLQLGTSLHDTIHAVMALAGDTAILPKLGKLLAGETQLKAIDELVTVADRESEQILAEGLSRVLPEAKIVGEEATDANPSILTDLGVGGSNGINRQLRIVNRSVKSCPDGRGILLDVSRLIWRAWGRRHPTGIDRVCLAYLEQFKERARAVVQRKGMRVVLAADESDLLFHLISNGRKASRFDWAVLGLSLLPRAFKQESVTGALYLNVGHTGLDDPSLPEWVRENELRAVYLVHDLIPLTHPQFCRAGENAKHVNRMENLLASASGVIANSRATLANLQRFAGQSRKPMPPHVVSLIAGDQHRPNRPPAQFGRPYFLIVGTIEARKNHILLLEVWQELVRELGDTAPMLVIVGQRGWEADSALAILDNLGELEGHVVEMNDCGDDQMASLISGARAALMPSFVEGFGLPVVEALQLSTPVIASDLPVYRELASNIPTYLDPGDRSSWLKAIRDFFTDGIERQRQLRAMADFRPPTWQAHFNQVEQWLAQTK